MNNYADEKQALLYTRFPNGSFLANEKNMEHFFLWNTFFRRNLHRVALDYFGFKLYFYQVLILYMMGRSKMFCIIASRAAAKSYIIAVWGCCESVVRPGSRIVLSSATLKQSKLIISEKIQNELMNDSAILRREIKKIKTDKDETFILFQNTSRIIVVPATENGRGQRSNDCVREEFRMIAKNVDDSILSPFQCVRQAGYLKDDYYKDNKDVIEEPRDIYISSSWLDDGHWMWKLVDDTYKDMFDESKAACLLAFDESVTLKYNIKTLAQLKKEKKKVDPVTWRIEFLNERVKENTAAYFTYKILNQNQRLRQVFYPRNDTDVRLNKKNKFAIQKQMDEIRVISCDMAFITNRKNDNSIFSCMRFLPESYSYETEDNRMEIKSGYRRVVPYMEPMQGGETSNQALRIRQLYEDFEADYIVLDTRNGGITIYDFLAKVMYDPNRGLEYAPLKCMNNDEYAGRIKINGAKPVIFCINASQQLNSDIASIFRQTLSDKKIDFLIGLSKAQEEILPGIPEYVETPDSNVQLFYENPFIETQMMISETANLVSEYNLQTGTTKIQEKGANRKDRYTSISYGNYFASLLELDLLSEMSDYDYGVFVN